MPEQLQFAVESLQRSVNSVYDPRMDKYAKDEGFIGVKQILEKKSGWCKSWFGLKPQQVIVVIKPIFLISLITTFKAMWGSPWLLQVDLI